MKIAEVSWFVFKCVYYWLLWLWMFEIWIVV